MQYSPGLVFNQTVTVQEHGQGWYGRTIGDVIFSNGWALNQELVKVGLVWWYRKYAPDNSTLEQLEAEARGGITPSSLGCNYFPDLQRYMEGHATRITP